MRILHVSDLHLHKPWFEWLIAASADFDLTAISGDLLNAFDDDGLIPQILWLQDWVRRYASRSTTPLVLCSGNHDLCDTALGWHAVPAQGWSQEIRDLIMLPNWMLTLGEISPEVIISDSTTRLVSLSCGKVIVSTIPFNPVDAPEMVNLVDRLWMVGSELHLQERCPWVVLHHDPPGETAVAGRDGNMDATEYISRFMPSFVLSGHFHSVPYSPSGSWLANEAGTICFNPGHPETTDSSEPNRIEVHTAQYSAKWCYYEKGSKRIAEKRVNWGATQMQVVTQI